MIKINLSDYQITKLFSDLKKQFQDKTKGVQIGFFDTAKYPNGTSVPAVAQVLHNGNNRIPPRPFFDIAIHENQQTWMSTLAKEIKKDQPLKRAYQRTAQLIRKDIVQTITNLDEPANAPATIAKKKSSNPLVDTRLLTRSVTYKLR